ncbi:MAG: hypothetical protein A2664_03280 [Candidatus Taylorbacteria bacterium RIFCSPHIGHO2_01_FULL_46_22b]|uniref:Uncharacterized protein n=1 Tax=Candidatus Taylorbacteria bacterium RIFCSPHIGHO2_01_FULL_46_22b TaxID=1802301 RepID=A0A1G2M177_9BACT|nr:MAG: hypothetical protein A2664_03280 [Candidatus Taylorbacteria bacterium RIFCSPHIGHO2_01_FULL_46_22b]
MKKLSFWGGLIGALIIAGTAYGAAKALTHPTDLLLVNIATGVSNLLWIGFGVFLIAIYLKSKKLEDAGHIPVMSQPNTPEDIELLRKRRNWVFGFVILFEILGSVPTWILNNYAGGLTLVNTGVIFDVLSNMAFLYIAIELFRDKKNVLNLLFLTMIFYTLGGGVIGMLRQHWVGVIIGVLFAIYFVYGIKAPLNRRNHRIAHLIILPAFVIIASTYPFFDNGNIPELAKKDALFAQEYTTINNRLAGSYSLYLEREVPSESDIQDVQNAVTRKDAKLQEIISNMNALQAEYNKQLPSIPQQKTLEYLRLTLAVIDLDREQGDIIKELMNYSTNLDFTRFSSEQKENISVLKDKINDYNTQITAAQFRRNNSNLSI